MCLAERALGLSAQGAGSLALSPAVIDGEVVEVLFTLADRDATGVAVVRLDCGAERLSKDGAWL